MPIYLISGLNIYWMTIPVTAELSTLIMNQE